MSYYNYFCLSALHVRLSLIAMLQNNMQRIQKELSEIQKEAPETISAGPVSDKSLFEWEGFIIGPTGTPYAGGMFNIGIQYPEDYPFRPPRVWFKTPIFHPNISKGGSICLDILKQSNWSPALTITKVLLSISSLLSDANPNDPLEPDIAEMYKENRMNFDITARTLTERYAM